MLFRCIAAENQKLRRSVIWLVFLIVPALSALYGTFNYLQNVDTVLTPGWYNFWTQHTLFYALLFFAPLVGIYAAYLWRLEHLGHNWNLIMTAPVHPFALFFSKFIVVSKISLFTQGWMLLLYLACGKLWAGLEGWPPVEIVLWLLRGVVGSFPIIALQLLLAMVIRSFAVPVLLALGGGIAGMALSDKMGLFWPYSLMILGMNSNKTEDVMSGSVFPFLLSCVAFTLLFFLIANWLLTKRDVRT